MWRDWVDLLAFGLLFGPTWLEGTLGTLQLTGLILFGLERVSLWLVNRNQPKASGGQLSTLPVTRSHGSVHPERYAGCACPTQLAHGLGTPRRKRVVRHRYHFDGFAGTSFHTTSRFPAPPARLQGGTLEREIPQKDGFAVYTLINDQLDRVIPATRGIELTQGRFPYLDEKTMQTGGVFADKRRVYTQAILRFQGTGLQQIMEWGYPRTHTAAHYQLLVDIIKKSEEEYKRRFGNDHFYVVVFPGIPFRPTQSICSTKKVSSTSIILG